MQNTEYSMPSKDQPNLKRGTMTLFFNWQLPTHLVGLKPKTSLIIALL